MDSCFLDYGTRLHKIVHNIWASKHQTVNSGEITPTVFTPCLNAVLAMDWGFLDLKTQHKLRANVGCQALQKALVLKGLVLIFHNVIPRL